MIRRDAVSLNACGGGELPPRTRTKGKTMGYAERTPPTPQEFVAYRQRFNNWGRWGTDDQLGTLNFITPDVRLAAAALVREGHSVSCSNPLATASVVADKFRNARPAEVALTVNPAVPGDPGTGGSTDRITVGYHGFVNTHIDALCHIFAADGMLYNGRSPSLLHEDGAETNSVEHWRDGIVTRGVLYDIAHMRGKPYIDVDEPVQGWELRDFADRHGITPRPGDAVLVRSGSDPFWTAHPDFHLQYPPNTPGLAASCLEFLYETDAALLGWDLMEATGQGYDTGTPIHRIAVPYMGLPLLDNANFERLSANCAEMRRYEFMLTVAPLVVNGGTGSPVNPIATF